MVAGALLGTAVALTCVGLWALPHRLWTDFGTPPGRLAWAAAGPFLWGLALSGILLFLDLSVLPTKIDLHLVRRGVTAVSLLVLLYGLVWDSE